MLDLAYHLRRRALQSNRSDQDSRLNALEELATHLTEEVAAYGRRLEGRGVRPIDASATIQKGSVTPELLSEDVRDSIATTVGPQGAQGAPGAVGATGEDGRRGAERYLFDTTTSMADPGAGDLRFNNATPASVTAIAIDATNADAASIIDWIDTWDDSTNTTKGHLVVRRADDPAVFFVFAVTALTNNTGWAQLTVTYVDHAGSVPVNGAEIDVEFHRAGDKGATGSTGSMSASAGTTFPGSPSDGDVFIINADITNGVKWMFQYRSAGGTYKWEYIGGSPMFVEDNDSRTLTNQTTYANLPTDPMSLTLPAIKGEFFITIEGNLVTGTAGLNGVHLSYAINNPTSADVAASDNWSISEAFTVTGGDLSKATKQTVADASATIEEKARTTGNFTGTFAKRRLRVEPIRCSN
jgi:hypothetical protein